MERYMGYGRLDFYGATSHIHCGHVVCRRSDFFCGYQQVEGRMKPWQHWQLVAVTALVSYGNKYIAGGIVVLAFVMAVREMYLESRGEK